MEKPDIILASPNNNSIIETAKRILEKEFNVIISDVNSSTLEEVHGEVFIPCSDKTMLLTKVDTDRIFKSKDYYPSPKFGGINIRKKDEQNDRKIMQRKIEGQEFTVDTLFSRNTVLDFAVRERHDIWNGISMRSVFTNKWDKIIKPILDDIAKEIQMRGAMNIQFIKDAEDKFWMTEINYRPCSNMCYGGEGNFILNDARLKLGRKTIIEPKPKEIRRWLSWEIKQ